MFYVHSDWLQSSVMHKMLQIKFTAEVVIVLTMTINKKQQKQCRTGKGRGLSPSKYQTGRQALIETWYNRPTNYMEQSFLRSKKFSYLTNSPRFMEPKGSLLCL
jgi:hypothetical protein